MPVIPLGSWFAFPLTIPVVGKTCKTTQIVFQTRYPEGSFETTWFEKSEKGS
jgi:hypothetical protein